MNDRSSAQNPLVAALATIATDWRDPDHPVRAQAEAQTLAAPNRFTEQSLAFALNHLMHAITEDRLRAFVTDLPAQRLQIGVHARGETPMEGLAEVLAVLLAGHAVLLRVPESSPYLLPTFFEEVKEEYPELPVTVAEAEEWCEADALIYSGESPCDESDTPALALPERFAVAVLDGRESLNERGGLAEDLLLYEGQGPDSVRIVFAPKGTSPDPMLDVLQQFRETFPAHPETNGALAFPRGFLAAAKQPHAWGEGFLLSKGAPEVQRPGHVRWSEYETGTDVTAWLREHTEDLSHVVVAPRVAAKLQAPVPVVRPGEAHRLPPDELMRAVQAFLRTLGA